MHHNTRKINTTRRDLIMQRWNATRWNVVQHELLPELRNEVGTLTPKLEKVIHTLEWVRIEVRSDANRRVQRVKRPSALHSIAD
jgi:hypothetical protein